MVKKSLTTHSNPNDINNERKSYEFIVAFRAGREMGTLLLILNLFLTAHRNGNSFYLNMIISN